MLDCDELHIYLYVTSTTVSTSSCGQVTGPLSSLEALWKPWSHDDLWLVGLLRIGTLPQASPITLATHMCAAECKRGLFLQNEDSTSGAISFCKKKVIRWEKILQLCSLIKHFYEELYSFRIFITVSCLPSFLWWFLHLVSKCFVAKIQGFPLLPRQACFCFWPHPKGNLQWILRILEFRSRAGCRAKFVWKGNK